MTPASIGYLAFYVVVLLALAKPLGLFMMAVYEGRRTWLHPVLGPLERGIYRVSGIDEALMVLAVQKKEYQARRDREKHSDCRVLAAHLQPLRSGFEKHQAAQRWTLSFERSDTRRRRRGRFRRRAAT